jgi:hypothetical protein
VVRPEIANHQNQRRHHPADHVVSQTEPMLLWRDGEFIPLVSRNVQYRIKENSTKELGISSKVPTISSFSEKDYVVIILIQARLLQSLQGLLYH